ncbi:MAG: hypothetical protein J3R72DRAFT_455331 [Linnemannia gamsii]|nr:MAG: hypothetical protein J3R72DRAFT_455331 [Linnemannia gamsii]
MRISIALLLALATGAHCFICPYGALNYPDSNTQHACERHKADFGYTGSCAGAGLKTYREILMKFEFQKADKCCKGRYKLQEAIIVYQQSSKLAIIGDPTRTNTIISGWKLGDAQYQNVVTSCSLT